MPLLLPSFARLCRSVQLWAETIKLEHSIFSAPFMLSAILLATPDSWPSWHAIGWASVALFGARTAAMSLNRVIDASIDAKNPRTANRAIASGQLSPWCGWLGALLGFSLMIGAANFLPPICFQLAPLAIVWLTMYPYTKRFTSWCHLVLGIGVAGAFAGGWLAVGGSLDALHLRICLLFSVAVAMWVTGFDVLYALQDRKFDRKHKLYSLVSELGVAGAVRMSHFFHAWAAMAMFGGTWLYASLYPKMTITLVVASSIFALGLLLEHMVFNQDSRKLEWVFFSANAAVATLFFLCLLIGKFGVLNL